MSPALNRSTALLCFERANTVEIHNRIMFDFYPGLPQIALYLRLLILCSDCVRLLARNGLVNKVEFLGLILQKVVTTNEIVRSVIACIPYFPYKSLVHTHLITMATNKNVAHISLLQTSN